MPHRKYVLQGNIQNIIFSEEHPRSKVWVEDNK